MHGAECTVPKLSVCVHTCLQFPYESVECRAQLLFQMQKLFLHLIILNLLRLSIAKDLFISNNNDIQHHQRKQS